MQTFSLYNNWIFPDIQTALADFSEYKKKEQSKWKSRATTIGARWPLFTDIEEFKASLKRSKVILLTDNIDRRIQNRSRTTSLDELKSLVGSYIRPRDVDRIVDGFKNNNRIPLPIILKGSKGLWIMSGNTRLDVAGILGVPKKALLVDVTSRPEEQEQT